MIGRTNVSGGGGAELELLWTNPSPSSAFSSETINANDYIGFVVDAKRMNTSADTSCLRNFVAVGTTQQLCGGSYENNAWNVFTNRSATASVTGIIINTPSDAQTVRCIPLRIYGIK